MQSLAIVSLERKLSASEVRGLKISLPLSTSAVAQLSGSLGNIVYDK